MHKNRDVRIEPFQATDRAEIRALCCDVAYGGRPLEGWLPMSRDLFADLFTACYTDYEPEHSFVARVGGEFAGYVLMTPDTRRHMRLWRRRIFLPAVIRVLTGRYRLPTKTMLRALPFALAWCRCRGLRIPVSRYPGHLHINIKPAFWRSTHVARALMSESFRHFYALGVPGVHGVVMTSRARMEEKYRRVGGFRVLGRCKAPRRDHRTGRESFWLAIAVSRADFPIDAWSNRDIREREPMEQQTAQGREPE